MDLQEIKKLAKLELAKRDFFYYCHLTAPDFYLEDREYLVRQCKDFQDFIEDEECKV